jgi:proline iminopeptidase
MIAVFAMYQNNGMRTMAEKLVEVFPDKEHIDKEKADKYFDPSFFGKQFFEGDDVSTVDMVNNMVLTCKETRNQQQTITLFMADENGNMVYDFYPHRQDSEFDECNDLGFEADEIQYSAKNYPFTAPVTYFQGTHDGATHPKGAVWHYRHAAKGRAQLLLAKNGGHSPNLSSSEEVRDAQQLVFEKALRGEKITKDDLRTISTKEIKWSMTYRE